MNTTKVLIGFCLISLLVGTAIGAPKKGKGKGKLPQVTRQWIAPALEDSSISTSYSGAFTTDDQVEQITFSISSLSRVTITTTSFALGGFDPSIYLFNAVDGALISENGDGPAYTTAADPVSGYSWDSFMDIYLEAGDYIVALVQYDNRYASQALIPNLADGFIRDGQGNFTFVFGCTQGEFCTEGLSEAFNRTSDWALTIDVTETCDIEEYYSGRSYPKVPKHAIVPESNAEYFSFRGKFKHENDVQLFTFTVEEESDFHAFTMSFSGGVQASGRVVPRGGFNPSLELFNEDGELLLHQIAADWVNTDPLYAAVGLIVHADSALEYHLTPGTYTLALMTSPNEVKALSEMNDPFKWPATPANLANGFQADETEEFTAMINGCEDGVYCYAFDRTNRKANWALDVFIRATCDADFAAQESRSKSKSKSASKPKSTKAKQAKKMF